MFTSIAVLFLQDDTTSTDQQPKFMNLLQNIKDLNYKLQIEYLHNKQLESTLREYLKLFDIVIAIGKLSQELYKTVALVYNENWATNNCNCQELMKTNDKLYPKHTQNIQEEYNNVLRIHRFYFVECESLPDDFKKLLAELQWFRRKATYAKVFNYEVDEKIQTYVDKLVECENGIKTRKLGRNEIIVSSACLNEINCLQKYLESNFLIERSYVLETCEENILNSTCSFIQEAIQCIKDCFDTYKPENVFISFNGGKDCTVLLHLMTIILRRFYPDFKQQVFCMYIQSPKPFPEVTKFIEKMRRFYNLDMHTLTSGIKDGLSTILQERPNLKACLMGTRRTDPFSSNLAHFQTTDNGWPELMRVSPLLDWEFAHVWDYLLSFKVPYCKLYDEGYTSLGNVDNTLKNPQLMNGETKEFYPAYRLLTSNNERSGRM